MGGAGGVEGPHLERCGSDILNGRMERTALAESTLTQVQRLVERLSPAEQARLLSMLALRISGMMTSTSSSIPGSPAAPEQAWEEFFRLGDKLADSDIQESDTLTAAVLAMRR